MTGASARPIECFQVINAAGPWSGEIAKIAGIGIFFIVDFFIFSSLGKGQDILR